ncbi:MAG: hypothetical protein HY363_01325 [Candidatus Aenigmarchaeota archaeon]|nr:hypothetical protein [Candidatus Aenigmarchaeota archaeon]
MILTEALKMFFRSIRYAFFGFHKYNGSAIDICKQIIEDCWNGKYYQTSAGHFSSFYTRDFGFCTPALIHLGQKERVQKTLEWAMKCFEKSGKLTTSITPSGKAFDFPTVAPDSLAFFLFSLQHHKELVEEHRHFLNNEIDRYYASCVDERTGLPKPLHFSSIKDHAIRKQSCYDTVMLGWLANIIAKLGLDNPFAKHNYVYLLNKYFWNKTYFLDDLSGNKYVSGDANTFPFWCGVIKDAMKRRKATASIENAQLDKPFPLKYTAIMPLHRQISAALFAPNYEGTTIWAHLGMLYVEILSTVDKKKAREHIRKYAKLIEQHKTFLELYNPNGTIYKTLFYTADEGMLWAANYLHLHKHFKAG